MIKLIIILQQRNLDMLTAAEIQPENSLRFDKYSNAEEHAINKIGLLSNEKKHFELYQKILNYPFDNINAIAPFSSRLAVDNAWSIDYTKHVIVEYKRFLFLMLVAGHKVAPSDQIDQAWHLHILSSYAYWEDFCGNTVHKKLHHWPAEGDREFHDWYRMTINSYIRFFGHCPPENIWVSAQIRLTTKTGFIRVDNEKNWIVKKPFLIIHLKNYLLRFF